MLETSLLIITTILTALLAGVFFGYAVSVNWALAKLGDREYVRAMQQINIVIQNGLFFLTFMGPVALLPVITYMARDASNPLYFPLLLAATILYIVGSFMLTVMGNVPYNERLAKVNADGNEAASARARFEKPWNAMHAVRTVASITAATLLVIACTL